MPTQKEIDQLFQDTKVAFEQSAIKQYAEERNLKWNYAISSTQLIPHTNLIVGLNWGVGAGEEHGPQKEIPKDTFKDLYDKKWLGSMERVYPLLKQYLPQEDIDNCVQTNFCFFRSKEEADIKAADLALSTPLFSRLITLLAPKRIIGFSHHLRKYLVNNNLLSQLEKKNIPNGRSTIHVIKGNYQVGNSEVPCFVLPHPGARSSKEARRQAWEFCFAQ
jgi:hypothetical protein